MQLPYSPDHVAKIKTVAGRRWHARERHWTVPALDRRYPNASQDWRWQGIFPQEHRWKNTGTKEQGRHHVDESLVQKAVREAGAS